MNLVPLARGDIVLAAFPYADLSLQKRRPALVLNENTDLGDVILAFISSQIPASPPPSSLLLASSEPEFQQTGLKIDSVIRLDKIATIERYLITRRLGRLPDSKREEMENAWAYALRISIHRS
ncbi:MAG: hypothetical protein DKINENOH_04636 [bacterium]|nr:hypothetical protein [bacterium]